MAKSTGLIKVKKDDEVLEINPQMLPQHEALGWVKVDQDDQPEEKAAPAEKPAEKKAGK